MSDSIKKIIDQMKVEFKKIDEIVKDGGKDFSAVENFGRNRLFMAFVDNNFIKEGEINNTISSDELRSRMQIVDSYSLFLDAVIDILFRAGYIKFDTRGLTIMPDAFEKYRVFKANRETIANEIVTKNNDMRQHIALLNLVHDKFSEILSGQIDPVDVIFPRFSMENVEYIFKNNKMADYFNNAIKNTTLNIIENSDSSEKIKILEVGAGTGGTSEILFEAYDRVADKIEYFYTDLSPGFFRYGKKKYGANRTYITFKMLDISGNPSEHGFEDNQFDIIIASNVVHATKNISISLNNCHKLLKKGGVVLLNELTSLQDFATLTFGLLDGWWIGEDKDKRINHSPLLSKDGWTRILMDNNFTEAGILTTSDAECRDSFDQSLVYGIK